MKRYFKVIALLIAFIITVSIVAGCGRRVNPSTAGANLNVPTRGTAGTDASGNIIEPTFPKRELPTTTEPDKLAGITSDTIYVGNTAGTTGALASIGGPFNIGIQAAFSVYNSEGGYQGKKIALKHYDDGGVATQSITLMEKLVYEDEVFAIVGNFASTCVAANLSVIKEGNIPMVYAAAGNDELLNEYANGADAGIFPVQPLNFTEGRMMILRAFAPTDKGGMGGKKVGVLSNSNEASKTMLGGIQAEADDQGLTKAINYQNATTSDFSAAVNAFKAAGCDVVVLTVIGDDFLSALLAMSNANYYPTVLTTYNNADVSKLNEGTVLAKQYENVMENIPIFAQAWLDTSSLEYSYKNPDHGLFNTWLLINPSLKDSGVPGFTEEYWKVAEDIYDYCIAEGKPVVDAWNMSFNSYALAGYIAGNLFCQGMKALDAAGMPLSRANFVYIMESQEFKISMADTISFANGMRAGVQTFALTMFYDTFKLEEGATSYHSAASTTVYPLMSIEEYREMLQN